jgi:hypothetical protein
MRQTDDQIIQKVIDLLAEQHTEPLTRSYIAAKLNVGMARLKRLQEEGRIKLPPPASTKLSLAKARAKSPWRQSNKRRLDEIQN